MMSFEPTASTSISPHVNTIVALSLKKPVLPEDHRVGTKAHERPHSPERCSVQLVGRLSAWR